MKCLESYIWVTLSKHRRPDRGTRTPDFPLPKRALCLLSYIRSVAEATVATTGTEPVTSRFSGERSVHLSYVAVPLAVFVDSQRWVMPSAGAPRRGPA